MLLCLPLLHPTLRSEVERVESLSSGSAQVGGAREQLGRKWLEAGLRDPVVAHRSMVDSLRCWGSSAERIWFPLKKFKVISG
jgi:hypothetical protein